MRKKPPSRSIKIIPSHKQPIVKWTDTGKSPSLLPGSLMEPVLAELVCPKCLESMFEWFLYTGSEYPDLDALTLKIPIDHVAPIMNTKGTGISGYQYCGTYRVVRLWKLWEDPRRYQENDSQVHNTGRV